jgi:selenide,water dikinase
MSRLNRVAAETLHEVENKTGKRSIHAVTDVTGFGLLGHAREMALGDPASSLPAVSLEFNWHAVPLLSGALEAAREGMIPGGLKNNREFLRDCIGFAPGIPEENRALFFDPQTSGGLLVAIAEEAAESALAMLREHGIQAAHIGRVLPKSSPLLGVV